MLAGCSDARDESREAAQRDLQQHIEDNLADRDDIPEADKAAAAAAIAQDFADLARESAAIQPEIDTENERLEQQLGTPAERIAQECAQRRLELDALQRLMANPERELLSDAERAALPAEVERFERSVSERCGG
jgi:hypothetical protein